MSVFFWLINRGTLVRQFRGCLFVNAEGNSWTFLFLVLLLKERHEFAFDVRLHLHADIIRLRVKLCPNLHAEIVLSSVTRLIKQSNPRKHVSLPKLLSYHLENQHLPKLLHCRDIGFEIKSEFSSLLIDHVFPLRLDVILKQAQSTHSFFLIIYDLPNRFMELNLHLHGLLVAIVEKVFNVLVRNVDPCLGKANHIVEPCYLLHRIFEVTSFVVLPDSPTAFEL